MALNFNNIQIDEELENLLPPLSKEDYDLLEQSLLKNGFEQKFGRIKVWFGSDREIDNKSVGYIVDGHNRYRICTKHKIELDSYCFEVVFMDSKEEVMEWMLDIQLGRRNLSPIQRIAVTEKYRPFYEKKAKQEQGTRNDLDNNFVSKLTQSEKAKRYEENKTNKKLAQIADVKPTLYKMGAKVINSNNEDIKQRVMSGKTSISAGYKELMQGKSDTKEQMDKELDEWLEEKKKELQIMRENKKRTEPPID